MRRLAVLAVAVLLVLAGCSGVVPEDDEEPDREPFTVDDSADTSGTESESDWAKTTPDYLAPGLTADGVENASLLVDRHFDALERESGNGTYVAVLRSNRTENGTLVRSRRDRHVVQYPERRYNVDNITIIRNGTTETNVYEQWATSEEALGRADIHNESVEYVAGEPSRKPRHPQQLESWFEIRLHAVFNSENNVTVTEETHDTATWYVVTMEEESDVGPSRTATVRIREDGLIEGYSTTKTTDDRSEPTEVSETQVTFDTDPGGTVERPPWYEDALEATTEDG